MFQKKQEFSCKTAPANKKTCSVHYQKRKAQIFISFIVGTSIFLSVCFAAAMLVNNASPVITNDLNKQKENLAFFSFTHRVMGNISEGEKLIEESKDFLSDCTLLDMNDPASVNNHTYIKEIFEIENNTYNIELNEHPIAVTTTKSGENYTGSFVIEGKIIYVTVIGPALNTTKMNDGVTPIGPLCEEEHTGSTFTDTPIYIEKIDKEGQFVIFKKQLVNCGNYPNKYALFQETNRYLISEDKNIVSVKLSLW